MLIPILQILALIVVAGILWWVIDRFCGDARLGWLLKALVAIIVAIPIVRILFGIIGVGF